MKNLKGFYSKTIFTLGILQLLVGLFACVILGGKFALPYGGSSLLGSSLDYLMYFFWPLYSSFRIVEFLPFIFPCIVGIIIILLPPKKKSRLTISSSVSCLLPILAAATNVWRLSFYLTLFLFAAGSILSLVNLTIGLFAQKKSAIKDRTVTLLFLAGYINTFLLILVIALVSIGT